MIVEQDRELSIQRHHNSNVVHFFLQNASKHPDRIALVRPLRWSGDEVSEEEVLRFRDLLEKVGRLRAGLSSQGFKAGDRVLILFELSAELYALILATLANGMVPVFLDATMTPRKMLQAVRDSNVRAVFSIPGLLKYRFLLPVLWNKKLFSTVAGGIFMTSMSELYAAQITESGAVFRQTDDEGLITFTTGSTGRPKGADRNHGILSAQHQISRHHWPENDNEIDMPCFPMIGLQNLACGITTVLPALRLAELSHFEPGPIFSQIEKWKVTRISGPPSFLNGLCDGLLRAGRSLPRVSRLITGGAPVSPKLCQKISAALPQADSRIVYGSTEAEPMASVEVRAFAKLPSAKSIKAFDGAGYLVGKPISEISVRVIRLGSNLNGRNPFNIESFICAPEESGEVLVSGPHVVRRYLNNERANHTTKLRDNQNRWWHRTEDLGYFDGRGQLWLTGRLSDQIWLNVKQVGSYPLELSLENIPGVERCGVVSSGTLLVAFIQLDEMELERAVLKNVSQILRDLKIRSFRIEFLQPMPIDRRHFWKIDRAQLRKLAKRF